MTRFMVDLLHQKSVYSRWSNSSMMSSIKVWIKSFEDLVENAKQRDETMAFGKL